MAAELETVMSEESVLIQSSGGVFEIEDHGQLIFSKKKTNRFPNDGEVLAIVQQLECGKTLDDAQATAASNVQQPPSFYEWLSSLMNKRSAK